jgi:hypothetical protein
MGLAYDKLNDTEQALWSAIESGRSVGRAAGAGLWGSATEGAPDQQPRVQAQLLCELLTGISRPDTTARALRLRGAWITGELDLEAASLRCPLVLDGCSFERTVILREAQAPAVRLRGCGVPGVEAQQLDTRGDLDLSDSVVADGSVNLRGAHIGGQLCLERVTITTSEGYAVDAERVTVDQDMLCDGLTANGGIVLGGHIRGLLSFQAATLIHNPNGYALFADGLRVDQVVFCRQGFAAKGEVRIPAGQIGGRLYFDDATLNNRGGVALKASRLTVGQDLRCRGRFAAEGKVDLTGAHINGSLDCSGATIRNAGDVAVAADRLTVGQDVLCQDLTADGEVRLLGAHIGLLLDFTGASLANPRGRALFLRDFQGRGLGLRTATSPNGTVNLTHARVGVLLDSEHTWPDTLALTGLTYETLLAEPEVNVHGRLRWLERDPSDYPPQPYEQLAASYRAAGREEDARRVAIAKQRRRRKGLHLPGKLWSWLADGLVGYGYRTWRAGLWLLGLLAVGTWVFAAAYPHAMTPTKPPAELPTFQPMIYALDTLVPIVDLRQQDAWTPHGVAQWWAWTSILAGWLLATAVAAGVTGYLHRD